MSGRKDVTLVRHVESQQLFVKKRMPFSSLSVCTEIKAFRPNGVPGIHCIINDGDSIVVIEDFVNGITIDEYLEQHGKFSEDIAISIICSLCRTLRFLHDSNQPIIHRDIKPSNVLIDSDFNPTLIDFDASKKYDRDKSKDTELIGTAAFAAPEQFGFAQSDARTDIFALGVLLNVMLTGHLPSDELYCGNCSGVIRKCTAIDPADRYQTVQSLVSHLPAKEKSFLPPGFRSKKPWKMISASIGYLLIIIAAFGAEIPAGSSSFVAWSYRIAGLLLLLEIVAFAFDWAGISSALPISSSQNVAVSWFGKLMWMCIAFLIIVLILSIMV